MSKYMTFLLISVFTIFVLAGCQKKDSKPADELQPVRYGGQFYPGEFLLDGYDFFSPQNVTVQHKIFSSGTENNEALISGNIDINVGSDSKSVALFNAMGDKALIIGTVQRGNRYSTMIRPDATYTDWADLKGKVVGTRFGSGAEFVLRKYFDSRDDLSWDDFEWVNIKTEDMIAALVNKKIEAFTVWAPTSEIAEAQGNAKLLRNFGDVALTPVLIHTTKDYADNNREALVRFMMGQLEKAKMIKDNPAEAAKYAATAAQEKGMDVAPEAFELIFQRINFQIDFGQEIIDELKETGAFLQSQGKIDEVPEFYWDDSFVREAQTRLAK